MTSVKARSRDLRAGADFRRRAYRREVFLRFYEFHLRYRSHPGGVYYLIPFLAEAYGWSLEERLWFAFLNGNTQNPAVSLILHRRFPSPDRHEEMEEWFAAHHHLLPFDTDRRHHKKNLAVAAAYYHYVTRGDQEAYWSERAVDGWGAVWASASAIPGFGRLSAFSYSEYLRIVLGPVFDCEDLLLADKAGSRSHRNGLAIVLGRDDLDWHSSNPGFDGNYTPDLIDWMEGEAAALLGEMSKRAAGASWADDVSYFTLESALCTYKSWHRPNRRYPNVYNDMMYDRLRRIGELWPDEDMGALWGARAATLPAHLRLEESPHDPGCVPEKQNYYRLTGCPPMMHHDWPCFANPLNASIDSGDHALRKGAR